MCHRGDGLGPDSDLPSVHKALCFYDQAVALDPGFAQAWAGVSYAKFGPVLPGWLKIDSSFDPLRKNRRSRSSSPERSTSASGRGAKALHLLQPDAERFQPALRAFAPWTGV